MSNSKTRLRLYISWALTLFIILTNNWMGWDAGIKSIAWDAASYEIIAQAAPSLPQVQLLFHHAQRIFGPYLAGSLSNIAGLPPQVIFYFLAGICIFASILFVHKSLVSLWLSTWNYTVCMSLFILNPFTLRYYMIAPGMLPDIMFVTGLAIILFGLIGRHFRSVLIGTLIAALGRQTAAVLIPGLVLWLYAGKGWVDLAPSKKIACISSAVLVIISVYFMTGHIVSSFASESINIEHLTGLFYYLAGPETNARYTFHFIVYVFMPFLVPLAVVTGISLRNRSLFSLPVEAWASLLFVAGIIAQPILAGPDITRLEGGRLSSLGIVPLIISSSFLMMNSGPPKNGNIPALLKIILTSALLTGSLHFKHTIIGPEDFSNFTLLQVAVSITAFLSIYFMTRPTKNEAV